MSKNERLFKISTILSILGFILIMGSGWIGNLLANISLNMVGGTADTNVYEFQKYTYSSSFLSLGSILFGVGLLTMIFSGYKKQENKVLNILYKSTFSNRLAVFLEMV